jgi:hypothetical protein
MATMGVLFTKAELAATTAIKAGRVSQSLSLTNRLSIPPIQSITPVFSKAALRMNMAAMVMGAGLLKTVKAWEMEGNFSNPGIGSRLKVTRRQKADMAITSGAAQSRMKAESTKASSPSTTKIGPSSYGLKVMFIAGL